MDEKKLAKNKRVSKYLSVILVIFALIYNVSPVDFIVDVTPLIGIADDVVVTLAAIVNLYMKWRKK
ncbi:MAG: DUF1232 domain-containing protein [Candidatus Gastranaerophilales bacterium]|nr:DUF1232 domain-containing protein [Candidatus Gastranaerophilales bacterium]